MPLAWDLKYQVAGNLWTETLVEHPPFPRGVKIPVVARTKSLIVGI